jgi:hypothetical protein
MKTKNLKIGITLGLKTNNESIWTNGIKQNVLMLVHLLKNSKKNYKVCILNIFDVDFSDKPYYLKDIDIHYFDDKFMDMDLIISMGGTVPDKDLKKFRESGDKKVISYKCGNNYVLSMEEILFKETTNSSEVEQEIDELWYVPQQDEVNRGYYTTLHRTNSIITPFIWHPKFLHEKIVEISKGFHDGKYSKDWQYEIGKKEKSIGIMEPNLNIVKFCLIPTMIVEESYRGDVGKEHIKSLRITNAIHLKENKLFMSYIKTFDMFKDKKITAEARYQTSYLLTQHIDVLVCHQILNPLNYLYLDATYLGYPVLHNASMCKDLGYYYEGSDTVEGAKMLDYILSEHDNNINEYDERNDKVLQRYHADNNKLVKAYDLLIQNLWVGGNENLKYNPSTNLYKK